MPERWQCPTSRQTPIRGSRLSDEVQDGSGRRVAQVARSVVVDGQPDARLADLRLDPAEKSVLGNADDDAHAAGPGVAEGAVDLAFVRHVDDAAAVEREAGRADLGRRGPNGFGRALERQMDVLEGEAHEPDAFGHGQGRVEVELAEGVGGQPEREGRRRARSGRSLAAPAGGSPQEGPGDGARRSAEKGPTRDPCHRGLL